MTLLGSSRWIPIALLLTSCGAKTGLEVEAVELDASVDAEVACVPFRAEARLAALDIFVMMDSSGSMAQETASGMTKAEAVTGALRGFVRAPESEGIGVALSFFPIQSEEIPRFCERDRMCGEPDACIQPDLCLPTGGDVCRTSADCDEPGDTCEPLGRCDLPDGADEQFCLPTMGLDCDPGVACLDYGFCENHTSCDTGEYSRPAVGLDLLPGVGPAVIAAMESREPDGGTPTLAALQGVLSSATAWGADNPGSKVIVILTTDGFPTACDERIDYWDDDPTAGIDSLAAAAAVGEDAGIESFVIGVFRPEDELDARRNLSAIAAAGGTDEALVITTAEPVTERLLEVLEELRLSVRTCVYAIPTEGTLPDPHELEVRIVPPSGAAIELERREGPLDCDPMTGGFYFEQDIDMGARPGYIELCPASCSITAASDEFVVEMQAGCEGTP